MALFVTVLLVSNTVAVKITHIGPFYFDGATILFPIAYIFGDILTEVYGYKRSRVVVWTGFLACIIMSFIYWLVGILPSAEDWHAQSSYMAILGQTPRIVAASMAAYLCGEFVNAYILARMKVATQGRHLWSRTIGSTILGQGVDTVIFVVIAFAGVIPGNLLLYMILSNYIFKTAFEILATPLTYAAVGYVKKVESIDYFDKDTDFNPFRVSFKDID
ncbi:MAG: transporter [Peptococcaceae bacterium BRH_c8a]|nr:MAG: transporter [Peptococcaceae bacterium BRH_c8a]